MISGPQAVSAYGVQQVDAALRYAFLSELATLAFVTGKTTKSLASSAYLVGILSTDMANNS